MSDSAVLRQSSKIGERLCECGEERLAVAAQCHDDCGTALRRDGLTFFWLSV